MKGEVNTEQGDTLVLSLSDRVPPHEIENLVKRLQTMFGDQQLNILVLPDGVSFELLKTSNLEDSFDAGIRAENPALQDAYEKYQTVKSLTKGNKP